MDWRPVDLGARSLESIDLALADLGLRTDLHLVARVGEFLVPSTASSSACAFAAHTAFSARFLSPDRRARE